MKVNPICKKEMKSAVRDVKIPVIITICSSLLALVALLNMYLNVAQVKMTAEIQYRSFLEIYMFVTVIEFLMLVFLMPALTSGAISGERERQTLDIMMTTMVSKWDIISGKLLSSLMIMFLVIVSTFPVVSLVFVYGGIGGADIISVMVCYITSALLTGGIGIFCSSLFKRSIVSTVVTYSITAVVFIGTYGVNFLAESLSRMTAAGIGGQRVYETGSGGFLYLLLLNPSATFISVLEGQMDPSQVRPENWFGTHPANMITENWILASLIVQLAAAGCFIWAAVKVMDKERLKRGHA